MKSVQFTTQVSRNGMLKVPASVASQIEADQDVKVIVVVPEGEDDADWQRLTADQFLKGYADSDAVYDDLPSG